MVITSNDLPNFQKKDALSWRRGDWIAPKCTLDRTGRGAAGSKIMLVDAQLAARFGRSAAEAAR
jgi:hypothetical protein